MNGRVLYFPLAGIQAVAEKIAAKDGCGFQQITTIKMEGLLRVFAAAVFYAMRFKTTHPSVAPDTDFGESTACDRGDGMGRQRAPVCIPSEWKRQSNEVCLVLSSGGGETEPVFRKWSKNRNISV
jgi:hypothetical protein